VNNKEPNIVLFDGICNLCNKTVQFIIRRDKKSKFRFASLQSEVGQQLLVQISFTFREINTLVYISENKFYSKSTAVLRIMRNLDGAWPLFYGFIIIPRFVRDRVYNFVAARRYKYFGKRESCMIPSAENKGRFLE